MKKSIVILGAGGMARETAWLIQDINQAYSETWNIVGFWEHDSRRVGEMINGIPVIERAEVLPYFPELFAVAAIGNPQIRKRAVQEAQDVGCRFATLVHPTIQYDPALVSIEEGSIVCMGSILTVNVTIGRHVIVNTACTIMHDCRLEDYVTVSPGCHLSGYTVLREGAFMGTGSVTVEHHEIGSNSIVGAGAVVTSNIPAGKTAVGVPAKVKL